MILVLEGPDFAGKSTTAQQIVERFGGAIRWIGRPPESVDIVSYYLGPVEEAAGRGDLTVFDRLHVSELVYGPLFRGESQLSFSQAREIEQYLDLVEAVKVHIDAPDPVLLERFRGPRGDDMINDEVRLIDIARTYRLLLGGKKDFMNWRVLSARELVKMFHHRLG